MNEVEANIHEATSVVYTMYRSFITSGFKEKQALYLVGQYVHAMAEDSKSPQAP